MSMPEELGGCGNKSPCSLWLSEPDSLDSVRTTEDLPDSCDVVIVGAGMAGCSAALRCTELGLSCCVVESRGVCGGATGSNGGHMWPSLDNTDGRHDFETKNCEAMAQLLKESSGPGESPSYLNCGGLEVSHDQEQLDLITEPGFEVWSSERVCEALSAAPGRFVGGMYHPAACAIWPARGVRTLARRAIENGANFQTSTAATRVQDDGEGATVETSRGCIRGTRGVLVCTNGWTSRLLPELSPVMTPARDHVIVTEPLKERVWKHTFCAPEVPGKEMAGDDFWYGLQLPDGRVVMGGGRRTEDGGYAYGEDDDRENDERVVASVTSFLRDTFPVLRDVKVEYAWSGIIGYSKDKQPMIGLVPGRKKVWMCAGFGGHGMPQCLLAARSAADIVSEDRSFCDKEGGYLASCNPARFGDLLASQGQGVKDGVAREKGFQACLSLAGKGPESIPVLEDAGAGSEGGGLPLIEQSEGGFAAGGAGAKVRSKQEEEELEEEIDGLFADLGVKRGEGLMSALTPQLDAPLPTMEPAAGEDMITEPIKLGK